MIQRLINSLIISVMLLTLLAGAAVPTLAAPGAMVGDAIIGSSDVDIDIPDLGDWVYSPIFISGAPPEARVTGISVHYEIVHSYLDDLVIELSDDDQTHAYSLPASANHTVYDITLFNGEPVNQEWDLWVRDTWIEDTGYIDFWWIEIVYNTPPAPPSNPSPSSGALGIGVSATLQWQASDADGDALTYDLYFDTACPPAPRAYGLDTPQYNPGILDYDTDYCWMVVAHDGQESTSGGVWGFTTETAPNLPPHEPSIPTPTDGEIDVSSDVQLSWFGGDPDLDPVAYCVFIETSPIPLTLDGCLEESLASVLTYSPQQPLSPDTQYYWNVLAEDSNGAITHGPVWTFTTEPPFNSPPNKPSNPSPANGASGVSGGTGLTWVGGEPDGDAVSYDVYLGTSNPPPLAKSGLTSPSFDPGDDLGRGQTYYWKVNATDAHGATTQGDVWQFVTRPNSPPTPPAPGAPRDGQTAVSVTPVLEWSSWDADGDPLTYDVYLDTLCPPAPVASGLGVPRYNPGPLLAGTDYCWQVVVHDGYETVAGDLWGFTTESSSGRDLAITALELYDIDNSGLEFLSAAEHGYFDGNTRIHGTITVAGARDDSLESLVLEVVQGDTIIATGDLATAAQNQTLQPFGESEEITILTPILLFEIPSHQFGLGSSADGELTLQVSARSANGQRVTKAYGEVEILVRYTGLSRYGQRDEDVGGDDWAKPSVKELLDHFGGLQIGDISNMNGGAFGGHNTHREGNDVDGWYTGYNARDAETAAQMIAYLNDVSYGQYISKVWVAFTPEFEDAIRAQTLDDGCAVTDIIKNDSDHDTHFHWTVSNTPRPCHRRIEITEEVPEDGARDVPINTVVRATFDQDLNAATVNQDTVQLMRPDSTAVSGAVSYDAGTRQILLTPVSDLELGITYEMIIRGDVRDASGARLGEDHSWSFETIGGETFDYTITARGIETYEEPIAEEFEVTITGWAVESWDETRELDSLWYVGSRSLFGVAPSISNYKLQVEVPWHSPDTTATARIFSDGTVVGTAQCSSGPWPSDGCKSTRSVNLYRTNVYTWELTISGTSGSAEAKLFGDERMTDLVSSTSCKLSGSVTKAESPKSIGRCAVTFTPRHGGSLSDESFNASSSNPNVAAVFADTNASTTRSRLANVLVSTESDQTVKVTRPVEKSISGRGIAITGVDFEASYAITLEPSYGGTIAGIDAAVCDHSSAVETTITKNVVENTVSGQIRGVYVSPLKTPYLNAHYDLSLLGGNDIEFSGTRSAIDTYGNVYVVGSTRSTNLPCGTYDKLCNGSEDIYVAKFDPHLERLLAFTFLGGSNVDFASAISVDGYGNVYVVGHTGSSDFPTTPGAYDRTFDGKSDTFVAKLDSNLQNLLASTFLGGAGFDFVTSLSSGVAGNVYVVGYTDSADFPTTPGAYDPIHSGSTDVFVTKLDGNLGNLLASTLLGGGSYDPPTSIATDSAGNVYVTGYTGSSDFPTTPGSYDTTHNGESDAFVTKFDGNLGTLLASTFLGCKYRDAARALSIDSAGNVFVAGSFYAGIDYHPGFPTTPGAYDDKTANLGRVFFVSRFDGQLQTLQASTYLGSHGAYDPDVSMSLDSAGNVYVASTVEVGGSNPSPIPTTHAAYDTTFNGASDGFVSKLDGDLTELLASCHGRIIHPFYSETNSESKSILGKAVASSKMVNTLG